jgi:hypothetical protein
MALEKTTTDDDAHGSRSMQANLGRTIVRLALVALVYCMCMAAFVLSDNQMPHRPFPKLSGAHAVPCRYFAGLAATILLDHLCLVQIRQRQVDACRARMTNWGRMGICANKPTQGNTAGQRPWGFRGPGASWAGAAPGGRAAAGAREGPGPQGGGRVTPKPSTKFCPPTKAICAN